MVSSPSDMSGVSMLRNISAEIHCTDLTEKPGLKITDGSKPEQFIPPPTMNFRKKGSEELKPQPLGLDFKHPKRQRSGIQGCGLDHL